MKHQFDISGDAATGTRSDLHGIGVVPKPADGSAQPESAGCLRHIDTVSRTSAEMIESGELLIRGHNGQVSLSWFSRWFVPAVGGRQLEEEIRMTDVWNNVTIYGPQADIEKFKRSCLEPDEQVFRDGQSGWDGCNCVISAPPPAEADGGRSSADGYHEHVWNFQQFTSESTVEYSFSFDTDGGSPEELFEELAERFPGLAFDCTCIEALDEFMGYGWFNAPLGGEEFCQDFEVPEDYWTSGCSQKRRPEAHAAHEGRIAELKAAAIEYGNKARAVLN